MHSDSAAEAATKNGAGVAMMAVVLVMMMMIGLMLFRATAMTPADRLHRRTREQRNRSRLYRSFEEDMLRMKTLLSWG